MDGFIYMLESVHTQELQDDAESSGILVWLTSSKPTRNVYLPRF